MPTINAKNPDLRALTSGTWKAIEEVNDPPALFQCEDSLVMLVPNGSGEVPRIRPVGIDDLRWFVTRYIDFFTGTAPARPPNDLLHNLIATPNPPLPALHGLVEAPVFARDGAIRLKAGYDPATGLYYARPESLRSVEIPENPSPDEIRRAVELLDDLICDFPFVDQSNKAHAFAALLLPFVRPMISGPTPLHLISKPKPGTGATLLATTLCIPAGLSEDSVMHLPNDEGERRRALLGILNNRRVSVILDNAKRLEGQALACCLTQEYYLDRLIGSSRIVRVPNRCLWLATGNNPFVTDEIARRIVPIRLDAKSEHPDLDDRKFKHPDLIAWATEERAHLVEAALTVIKAWIERGMPAGRVKPLGGFESWSKVMGGILENASVGGFLGNLREYRAKADTETATFGDFVQSWEKEFGSLRVPASKLVPLAVSLDLESGRNGNAARRLGIMLGEREGQRFGDWIIERDGLPCGTQQWRLKSTAEGEGGNGGSGG